ncbi:coiled-coil domain-containing protein 15 isoform X2 [Neoarius graeffei]|uniref:coiled-coil domain-containing protein 15 isoform X2 n=1 Tax=Neoarius graeffei TaxID=443677 RepID=UPI00298CE273|nr:coiled-coil domain-containing protein 15 isoform X2 [Neoarius graeffei]
MSQPRNVRKSETNQRGRIKDGGQKGRTRRKQREMRVLAERNLAVVPVGAWVETGEEEQEHPAVRALLTEELLEETRRLKEENLRQFQDAVRRRVSEQARMRKQQQLQKSYKTAEREYRVTQKSSDYAEHLTPRKSQFPSWPQGELGICNQNARWVMAQELNVASSDDANQYRHQLSKIMKQVRHRLAACQTVQESKDLSELPGGIWKVSSTRDKTVRRIMEDDNDEEVENEDGLTEEEEVSLAGQHDWPVCLQNSKTVMFQNNLRRSHFLMYRRLFMDLEREQVKEHQRHKKHLRRIARIKAEKEQQREEEERRMERTRQQEEHRRELAEREHLILERLRLEEEEQEEEKRRARVKKSKENTRYVEALRAQIKEKLEQEKVELPPLCCCGESFWDSHPDTCANNCVFYNNPKSYAQALLSVLLSCELNEGDAGRRSFTRKIVRTLAHHS